MIKMLSSFLIPVIAAGMLSCNAGDKKEVADTKPSAAFDMQKAKAFIDSINLKFSEEIAKGDSLALAAHYSADAELLFEHAEPIKGKDILSAWGSFIRSGVKEMKFTTTDITANAELLVETGSYIINGDKGSLIDKGKYLVVWKTVNGEWKLFRDMGNTSLPPAAAK